MGDSLLEALRRDESYSVVKILAEKASGSTELVSSPGAKELYVRKRIPVEIANRAAWVQLARISDRYLPRVIETYELPDWFVVVCEYVEGYSLAESVDCAGKLDAARAAGILEGVCRAAGVLHGYDIVHRDISPSNVIVAADGAHLIDLGIARVGDTRSRHDTTKLGTWGFAAPEQYGFAQTDARSDVYSIGSLAAYMLTGIRPGEEGFEQAVAGLPTEVRACIDRACSFEPSARCQSAAEFLRAFRAACVGQADPALAGAHIEPAITDRVPDRLEPRKGFLISFAEIADAWAASSIAKRLATAALLFCAAAFCWGLFLGTFKAFVRSGAASGLIGLIFTLSLSWVILETLLMNLKAGPYARASSRFLTLLKRGGIPFAIGFIACFVIALIEKLILAVLAP
ncbi:serine/threonine protein kinase [Coriobacteriales bacterium OH1046]|nr:serine/threonine protein kinase [Coriobacteriales bacterium OH1046]